MITTLRSIAITAIVAATLGVASRSQAVEAGYMKPLERAQGYNWHGTHYHSSFGQPVALVVPPTAQLQTNWGWGVGSSRVSRIDHQFGRNYPGYGPFGGGAAFRPLPRWPHDTTNFGVYYVRGPW